MIFTWEMEEMQEHNTDIQKILSSRKELKSACALSQSIKMEAEGGCGVIGLASSEKVSGKHLSIPLKQMCNRGNGKGGGIAAAGLSAEAFGVSNEILDNDYLLAIAYLDLSYRAEIEQKYIYSIFDVDHTHQMPQIPDYKAIENLETIPPNVVVYFVQVKKSVIQQFQKKHNLNDASGQRIEDEIVYQNSHALNTFYYASEGEKIAFVLSHGKNLLVLKLVGYGEDVIRYYKLEDFKAHVWIGHHRYPTKGRVWHPGGAHPFIGLNEALIHNGDFANYSSLCEYLAQRNIHPHFLTDTEVSVLLFDLLHRTYQYPLEYVIEALAPTTERDFTLLSKEKQYIYQMLQKTHMQGSPDGPWFFVIAQSLKHNNNPVYSLIGITDTSMLRPQVFALQKGEISIGFTASEKQAIDATLQSLSSEDSRFWSCADKYWNARGGSHSDGGAFTFSIYPKENEKAQFVCTNKFGNFVDINDIDSKFDMSLHGKNENQALEIKLPDIHSHGFFKWITENIYDWDYDQIRRFLFALNRSAVTDKSQTIVVQVLTKLIDQEVVLDKLRRSCLQDILNFSFENLIAFIAEHPTSLYVYLGVNSKRPIPESDLQTLVIDANGFPAEGNDSLAMEIVKMRNLGFKKFIVANCKGQRFIANGLGANTHGVQIDVYGSSGDYLASGIDGAIVTVHGSAQDQLAQIMKDGTLIVHGDVGQTFMYGAKGGTAFIRGNAAGRPLINAVGKPRVVINGTCLDYLAESFMAGSPLNGGGFVIVNGITFEQGEIRELDNPYPGNNLFSLASGGAIYLRDPKLEITEAQLNGGEFVEMTENDWKLILPYLESNAKIFDIPISRLLEHKNVLLPFHKVYRKIRPAHTRVLHEEEAWVKGKT